jgi:tripartite-type tricarboxylate transporter receptor subunit TctC
MKFPRRHFLHIAAGAGALAAAPHVARAQTYPSRPITMIVPFPAGGATDVIGRIVAERMRRAIGQPIIIENVGGADGSIGVGRAARARPDGYTICLGLLDTHVLSGVYYSLTYDVLNDFAPISPLAILPIVLFARKTMPAKDLGEFVAWLKAHPNQASAGMNTLGFRVLAMFLQKQTNTQFTIVPYRAAGGVMQDSVAGRIDFGFATLPSHLPLLRAGSEKIYAITSDARSASAPEVPTFVEGGLPALSMADWIGLFAPKGTPMDILGKLNAAAMEALADAAVQSRLAELGFEVFPRERRGPEALAAMQKAGAEKWWPIMRELRIRAE